MFYTECACVLFDFRIVLERPEYGYATYFFELVDSSPIEWQVKRLVTAMKLTCCGRVNVIENKLLRVNFHLLDQELLTYYCFLVYVSIINLPSMFSTQKK